MQDASTGPGLTAPESAYLVGGRRFETGLPGFAEAIAVAHASHHRPRCLCLIDGIEMYVARLGDGFIVKRMPNTGNQHAPDCPSYEPPAEFSGLGQVLGTAITEDPATGETALKLGFSMSKINGRSSVPAAGSADGSVATNGTKLSLRGLLHYLWDQAELTRWRPGCSGERSWATVRRHVLLAAENKLARGVALQTRLYIPEVFSVGHRDAINARRIAQWAHAVSSPGKPQHLMLLIAEVKEIVPARYGFKAVVKHVPDQAFSLDEELYRRLGRRFEPELSLWGAADNLRMVMIATFAVNEAGVPTIAELSLMPVNGNSLPIENSFEQQLIDRLVHDGRSFVKALRYNLPVGQPLATAILTDAGKSPVALCITPRGADAPQAVPGLKDLAMARGSFGWVWHVTESAMPPLPGVNRPMPLSSPSERPLPSAL